MSMFKELYQVTLASTLTLVISADEKQQCMTISVIPKPKADVNEPALSTPLTLTASPDEFDAEFVQVLKTYRSKRLSLAEQAETTNELLDAAKEASANKGAAAVAKASAKPVKPLTKASTAVPSSDDEDVDVTNGDDAETRTAEPTSTQPQLFG